MGEIFEEQAFIGRCGQTDDEIGSRLIAAKQVKNLMQLCFYIEQRYAPYSKWFSRAFSELEGGTEMIQIFENVLDAGDWKKRETYLTIGYKKIIRRFNDLNIGVSMNEEITDYYGRPFLVIKDESIVNKLREEIVDQEIIKIGEEIRIVN